MGYSCYNREVKGPVALDNPLQYKDAVRAWCTVVGKLFTSYGLSELEFLVTTKLDNNGEVVWNISVEYSRSKNWRRENRVNSLISKVTDDAIRTVWQWRRESLNSVHQPVIEDALQKIEANPLLRSYLDIGTPVRNIGKVLRQYLDSVFSTLSDAEILFLATSQFKKVTCISVAAFEDNSFLGDIAVKQQGADPYEYTANDMLTASQNYTGTSSWVTSLLESLKHWS